MNDLSMTGYDPDKESTRNYRVVAMSTVLTRMTHMAGVSGNAAMIQREPVTTPNGVRMVPWLTGNALRHASVRGPLIRSLVRSTGRWGELSAGQAYFLFHGGTLTESNALMSLKLMADLRRVSPALSLLGGSFPAQLIPGRLQCESGKLVCRENAERIKAILRKTDPELADAVPDRLRDSDSFVGEWTYFRHFEAANHDGIAPGPEFDRADGKLMVYGGQAVNPGAVFVHGYQVNRATKAELGALIAGLTLWRSSGSSMGGGKAKGHGQLDVSFRVYGDSEGGSWSPLDDAELAEVVDRYDRVVSERAEDLWGLLDPLFGVGNGVASDAAPKGRKPKKGKADPGAMEKQE